MARGSKRLGMTPAEIDAGAEILDAAYCFLTQVTARYPIIFDETEPYGAAHEAHLAIAKVGTALTGSPELFYAQKPRPPKRS